MSEELRICANCKHSIPIGPLPIADLHCYRNATASIDLVTGKKRSKGELLCSNERGSVRSVHFDICGKAGFYYEEKEPPLPPAGIRYE